MSPRPPRNRVTTALSLSPSLFEISLRKRHGGISARVFSSIVTSLSVSLLYPTLNGAIFHFRVRPNQFRHLFLPSFLPSAPIFHRQRGSPTWIRQPASQPARVHSSVETYVEMKFRFNFSRLLCVSMREEEGGKEINKKEGGR